MYAVVPVVGFWRYYGYSLSFGSGAGIGATECGSKDNSTPDEIDHDSGGDENAACFSPFYPARCTFFILSFKSEYALCDVCEVIFGSIMLAPECLIVIIVRGGTY
jgi:hypothetical protein